MKKPAFEIRQSPIAGKGAFAIRRIRKGTRLIEYTGERLTVEEADARYGNDRSKSPHVVLFIVDKRTVIDGGANGNDARFFNHSCEPNCQTVMDKKRIYIETLKTVAEGEELVYDYHLDFGEEPTARDKKKFACLCGAETCRGTMLAPKPKKKTSAKQPEVKKSVKKRKTANKKIS